MKGVYNIYKKSVPAFIVPLLLSGLLSSCKTDRSSQEQVKDTAKPSKHKNEQKGGGEKLDYGSYNGENTFERINIAKLFKKGLTGKNVNVALLDDGFNFDCEELLGKNTSISKGGVPYFDHIENYPAPGNYGYNYDKPKMIGGLDLKTEGHGAHMSRILAGEMKNNSRGVSPGVEIFPLSAGDTGIPLVKWFNQVNAIKNYNLRIASISNHVSGFKYLLGEKTNLFYPYYNEGFSDTLFVSIAGNDNSYSNLFSSNHPAPDHPIWKQIIITVAVGTDNKLTHDSRRCGSESDICIAVPSPGPTSPTAPVVAGAVAILMEAFPGLKIEQYQKAILDSATALGDPQETGRGMLNVYGAYQLLETESNK